MGIFRTGLAAVFVIFLGTQGAPADDAAAPTPPDLSARFSAWSAEPFAFSGQVSNQRRTRPDFRLLVGETTYPIIFDAGRAKRNAVLDCLELSDQCDIRGTGFMLFERGQMTMNITDITWLSIPPIDFDMQAMRFHRCVKAAARKRDPFASVVEAKLGVLDIEAAQTWQLEPVAPREGGRGYELLEVAVATCFQRHRMRLPVGEYRLKVFTQSGETFLSYFD
ncbi:MAG: hypothetical protein AAF761_00835 [Pseudomonadota bacterium]